jgi:hypothetical protein
MAFDFDTDGAALDYLMRPESTAWTFGSFAYSTPSSTENHPKSRVVFVLAEPIETPEKFRALHQALAAEFEREGSKTDPSCKDSLRLYYGSPDCKVVTNWSVLTPGIVDFFIERYEAEHPPVIKKADKTVKGLPPSNDYIERRVNGLLEKVVLAADGEKHTTLNKMAYTLGGLVAGGHLDRITAVEKAQAAITANGRADDLKAAFKTVEGAIDKGMAAPIIIEQSYKRNMDELL